ncbi:conserved hypothetical protein [Sporisorium reilianum SRZ2]|uniref:Protein YAE1 n=1 Tax=Sporisorium reilianum (strain SRZ2) TaxID=999809 RepID=E6ZM30_SPORE|nr:conserved hypothetical protein [Sporisorium reilianum SRZ2]
MDPSLQQEASNLRTPQMGTSSATPTSSTPSRKAFPRRLSLLQNDTASPVRATTSSSSDDPARTTSFTGPKPLSLGSQPITSASASAGSTETPRQSKRSSITYIPSPSTSLRQEEVQLSRAPSTSSASGRTRTGSISRATAGAGSAAARRRTSQASQANSDADDWLMNDQDAASSAARSMAERDSAKVDALFNDTGYREGITAGKLSTLQLGFDQGFNEVGATLGRQVGVLRGQVAALLLLTSPASPTSTSTPTAARRGPTRTRGLTSSPTAGAGASTSSLPILANPRLEQAKVELSQLAIELDAVTLDRLAEKDYEAMEHEAEHQEGAAVEVTRETHAERAEREQVLEGFKQRVRAQNAPRSASRRTLSLSSDDSSTSRDLLRLIAEKERRCFELREELASEETQLKHLRSTWQRMATKELAYSTSPPAHTGAHRRDGSSTSSTSDAATDAWNSFSSKLPGSIKTQLSNLNTLLESIANPEAPEAVASAAQGEGMLRPTGGGLGVLEEEGSDVGSVVSPRSPRSPAMLAHADAPGTLVAPRSGSQLAALARQDSRALGFSVDANGIAHPSGTNDEMAPPTPPKPPTARSNSSAGNTWTARRTSMLSSLSSLTPKHAPDTADEASGGGFASMFARRLKEARSNASDMLREAERKLGNAMTIDELLGKSPQITLDEASTDSTLVPSPWYAAAGGSARRPSSEQRLSPGKGEAEARRLSVSSSRSSSSASAPVRVGSPHMSPVIGGAPGAAGVFGMLLGSQTELGRRASGDSWGWGGKEDEDEDGWGDDVAKK